MTRVLVTGGTGFIGSHLVQGLLKSGKYGVTVLSNWEPSRQQLESDARYVTGSLSDLDLVTRTLQDHKTEVIYHLAWDSIHETSVENTAADLKANLMGTVNLLEACRKTGVRRVIFLSSGGTVYGLPSELPVNESHATNPICAYGVTKLAAEKYLGLYRHLYAQEFVIFRPSVPFGPGQDPSRRQGAIGVFIDRALRSEPVTVWGDGSSLRDYFYIGDMIGPLIRAMSLPVGAQNIFNLGGPKAFTLNEVIHKIEETLDLKMTVRFQPARKFDVPDLKLDCSRATEAIGWQPDTSLEAGILATEKWLRERRS